MNIGYVIVIFMFLFITQLPCFVSLLFFFPLSKIFKYKILMRIPHYLGKKAFSWVDELFFNIKYIKTVEFDKTKRYIYLPNHQTSVDALIIN